MNIKKAKGVLEKIALQNNTTVENVKAEIQNAIDIGYASLDPEVQKKWKSMTVTGRKPTPEETIVFLTKKVNKIL